MSLHASQKVLRLGAPYDPTLTSPEIKRSTQCYVQAFEKVGYKVEFVHFPILRSLVQSNKGAIDGEISRIKNISEFYPVPNLIRVETNFAKAVVSLYATRTLKNPKDWSDLNKEKFHIGYRRGQAHATLFRRNNLPRAKPVEISSTKQAIAMLGTGRIHALIEADIIMDTSRRIPKLAKFFSNIKKTSLTYSFEHFPYLNVKHREIVKPLEKEFDSLTRDSYCRRLFQTGP